jgi:glucose-6-phosphate isomerase
MSLIHEASRQKSLHLRDVFAQDPARFTNFHVKTPDMLFDYSRHKIDETTLSLLEKLAVEKKLAAHKHALFAGERVNSTENRAAGHFALRDFGDAPLMVEGRDVRADIHYEREKALTFAENIRHGVIKSASGKPFKNIVNIGIGGSDLGPAFVVKALKPYTSHLKSYFVSNVDPSHLADTCEGLDLSETLFIVASKTFTTLETMLNAKAARAMVASKLGEAAVSAHFCAVSTNIAAVNAFGIDETRMFRFWDFVGGRYSVWSVVGLSVMLAIGRDNFISFLKGAQKADQHFKTAPFRDNIPELMAMIGVFYRNFMKYEAQAVLPFDERLSRFPAYLQQLDMESNGKSVKIDGSRVTCETGAVIWGEPGTNGQHAFFQLLHQGTSNIPVDFLAGIESHDDPARHEVLLANALGQAASLMQGRAHDNPHRRFDGDRPSSFFLYQKLTPEILGMLIAFYEHKVFVQSVIWEINAFDQWGVELGKEMATKLLPAFKGEDVAGDSSTMGLLNTLNLQRG